MGMMRKPDSAPSRHSAPAAASAAGERKPNGSFAPPHATMDIPRTKPGGGRRFWLAGAAIAGLVAIAAFSKAFLSGRPTVDLSTLLTDSVRIGDLNRTVHASGSLIPDRVRIVSASTAGRIEAVLVQPGVTVAEHSIIARLSNPD